MQIRTTPMEFELKFQPFEWDLKHWNANSNYSNSILSIWMQIWTIQMEFETFECYFEPLERDSNHSNGNLNHSNGIPSIW